MQLEYVDAIERRLWSAADTLRANSNYASNEYFLPVMGLVFLRHAFGRIYEYFLTQFADQKAHDGGEFFTPSSLVSLIAHVLDPERGTILDPACGSGGMFVQSARTVREQGRSPTERLTFRGLEKNAATIRLARMNLAVHGLEGDIRQAITYYEDPHELVGKADYVMAIRRSTWTKSTPRRSRPIRACRSVCPASTGGRASATATTSGSATSTAT